jgi:hypothetical protein
MLTTNAFNFVYNTPLKGFRQTTGLKLNDTRQLLDCNDYVNMLGKNTYTIQKNTEALLVTSKQFQQ